MKLWVFGSKISAVLVGAAGTVCRVLSTVVVSIAIFDHVESLDYAAAHRLSAILLIFAFVVLLGMFLVNRRLHRR